MIDLCTGRARGFAARRQAAAGFAIGAARFVRGVVQLFATMVRDQGSAVGDDERQQIRFAFGLWDERMHLGNSDSTSSHHVFGSARCREWPGGKQMRQQQEEYNFAVGFAEHVAAQARIDVAEQQRAVLINEARHIAVVREDPATVLKRMAVEYVERALRRFANMSKYSLARHHAADAMKQRVAKCVRWAFRYVRRTVDKISNAPTVRMPVALPCQRIIRCDQRTMHLTGDYATKPKQSAHVIIVLGNLGEFMFSVRDAYRKSGSQCWLRQTRMMLSGQNASKVRRGCKFLRLVSAVTARMLTGRGAVWFERAVTSS